MTRRGQVQAGAAGFQRQHEHAEARLTGRLETLDHAIALRFRHAAVQEQHLASECLLQVRFDQRPHLGELREHERALVRGQDLVEHLGQPRELA